ncbi:MAG TPA: ATP-binding protein [Polyangia bacterium]|nr:ATP-binding protein [Polyangia bacterium]
MAVVAPDFRLLFESVPALYLVLAPDLTIVAVSDAYLRATKTERDAVIGRGLFQIFPDDPGDATATGVSNLRSSLERVLRHRRPDAMAVQKYAIRRPASEGGGFEERHWSPVNSPVFDDAGQLQWIIHRVEDVTEFVRLKEQGSKQHEAAEELRTRAGQMEAEIHRRAQEIQEANRQLRRYQEELEWRVEARTAELQSANEALRKSEEQLRQSQKLEALGRLAGGIAHDFNNLLSVILSCAEIVSADLKPGDPAGIELQEIKKAGGRAAELTRQMLAFSRQQVLDLRIVDLNEVVAGVNKMLARVLGEDVELKALLAPRLANVRADPGQIEQVLMNLVVNARDAMPSGGKLTIETSNVELDAAYAREHLGVPPGRYVMLAVSDTGTGMDRNTQARIFEPFFTTKDLGRGTGLGLSTVFGIVKQIEGHIWVYSEPGAGTTFKIYLPQADGKVAAPPAAGPPAPDLRGTETILLVEDEEQVRAVAVGILKKAGYHVLEARTPGEALLASEEHPVEIHLLVTDVVMPKMNGRQLADRIAAMRPAIKTIFMSGYTDNVILHHGVLDAGVAFLQKPFTPTSLARKVREVLGPVIRPQ